MAERLPTLPPAPDGDASDVGSRSLLPPPRQRVPVGWWVLALLVLALAAAGWWMQRSREAAPVGEQPPTPMTQAEPVVVASAPSAPASAAAPPEPGSAEAPLEEPGVAAALAGLVGEAAARGLLIPDDFVQRLVVTIDNLPREHAAPRLWPLRTTPGRLQVIERNGQLFVDADNAARYTPLVLLVEQVDAQAAVALYGRLLPLLQRAYEQLGYPNRRFHDRLVAVIDHLLAAPEAPEPIALTLLEVKGELPSQQPWLRYEFADPALQSASAGHKMMVRVGAVNERRLKARLRALRAELDRQAQR
jgi:hypothetical protein